MLKVGQPDVKVWLIGKDLILGMIEGRRRRDDRGWDGCMASLTQWTWFEQALGAGNGQGSLECCSPWTCKESNMTKELNWTELKSKCKCTLLSRVQLFVTPCTIWSMEFSRPEYWSGSPLPSPGDRLTQGSNPGLPHCRQILYQLSQKGSPRILEWVAYPFSSRSSWPRNQTRVSCIAGRFFTNWAIREALKSKNQSKVYKSHHFMAYRMKKQWKRWQTLFSWAPRSPQMVTAATKLKDASSLEEKLWSTRQHIKEQKHYSTEKCPSS